MRTFSEEYKYFVYIVGIYSKVMFSFRINRLYSFGIWNYAVLNALNNNKKYENVKFKIIN